MGERSTSYIYGRFSNTHFCDWWNTLCVLPTNQNQWRDRPSPMVPCPPSLGSSPKKEVPEPDNDGASSSVQFSLVSFTVTVNLLNLNV